MTIGGTKSAKAVGEKLKSNKGTNMNAHTLFPTHIQKMLIDAANTPNAQRLQQLKKTTDQAKRMAAIGVAEMYARASAPQAFR